VCPNNYKEEEIRSLKWMITSKHKQLTSNKLGTTKEIFSGDTEGYRPMSLRALAKVKLT
jgi:hypothetical protein